MNYYLILIAVLLNIFIFFFYKKIIKILNIYDQYDGFRKFQKTSVPIIGGFIVTLNILIISLCDFFLKLNFIDYYFFTDSREFLSFFAGIFSFYLFGLYDDRFNLNANIKLLISSFLVYFLF